MSRAILVTGGLGYIGSHTVVALAAAGYAPAIVDNLANTKRAVLPRLAELAGREIDFHEADLRDRAALERVFAAGRYSAVIHFAGLKAVGESVEKPLLYWDNNVGGTVALLEAMRAHGVRQLVFSSSATVYGEPERLPIGEALRYFNPTGAHPSGRIGEDPNGIPNNLFPYLSQVAVGRRPSLRVWGRDYPTPDGTGVRDYIHVMDLAEGHVAALGALARGASFTVNLGTGRGYSVLEAAQAFGRACGKPIPLEFAPRRPGDVAACYADPAAAARTLGWRARLDLDAMCRDVWRWQSANPHGY